MNSPYSDAENVSLREALLTLLRTRQWTQTQAAEALGLSQQSVSAFLGGRAGAGPKVARSICRLVGRDEAEILGHAPPVDRRTLSSLPEWEQAYTAALTREESPPEYAFHHVGQWPATIVPRLTVDGLIGLARGWRDSCSTDELMEAVREWRAATRALAVRDSVETIAPSETETNELLVANATPRKRGRPPTWRKVGG